MKTWNERFAEVLAESGMKKSALATTLGVSAPTVQAWVGAPGVAPAVNITGENLLKVCRLLHVNPEWLILARGPKRDAGSASDAKRHEGRVTAHEPRPKADQRISAEALQLGSLVAENGAKNLDAATVGQLKQEIVQAVADGHLSNELLVAITWMIRAGSHRSVQRKQHRNGTDKSKPDHALTRRRTGVE
jgi:DNA-binding Xre family transcriptional regulator